MKMASEVSWKGERRLPPRTANVRLRHFPGFLFVAITLCPSRPDSHTGQRPRLWSVLSRGCPLGVKNISFMPDSRVSYSAGIGRQHEKGPYETPVPAPACQSGPR